MAQCFHFAASASERAQRAVKGFRPFVQYRKTRDRTGNVINVSRTSLRSELIKRLAVREASRDNGPVVVHKGPFNIKRSVY